MIQETNTSQAKNSSALSIEKVGKTVIEICHEYMIRFDKYKRKAYPLERLIISKSPRKHVFMYPKEKIVK